MGSDNETMSTFVSNLLNAIRTCSRDNIFEQIQQDLKDVQMVDDIFVKDLTSALFDCHTRHRDYLRRSSEELQDDDQEEEEEEPLEDTILKEEEEEQDSGNDDPNENGETCNENSHKFVTRFDVNHIDISSDCSSIDNYGSEEDSQNDMEEDLSNMHINEENMNSKNKRDLEQDTATINLAFEFNSTRLSPSKSEEEDYLSARATATSHPSNTEKDTEDPLDRSNHVRKDMDDTFVSCCNDTVGGDEFHDAMETQTHPTNSTTGAAEDTAHHHKSMHHANQVFPDISVEYPPDSSEDEVEEKTQDSQNKDNVLPNHENTFNTGDSIPKFSFGKTPRASSARNIFESTTRSPTFLEAKSIFEAKTASTPQQRNTFSAGASFHSKQNFNDGFTSNQNSKCNVCGASHSGLKNTCSECENVQKEESARSDFISTDVPTFHIGQSTKTEKKRGSPRRLKLKSKSINASFDSTVNESSTENVNTPVNKERSPFCSPTEYMELDTPHGNVDIGGISFNLGKANIAREKRIHSRKLNKSKSSNGAKKSQTESAPSKDQTSHDSSNIEQMIKLRDEGKDLYKAQQYRASIIKYTESVRIFTDNFKALPNRRKDPEKGDLLASLYGNRAAGWMMVGAYQTAYEDCQRALEYLDDFNPVGLNLNDATIISVAFKPDRGVTLMVKLLARMGRAKLKCGLLDDAEHSFNQTIRIAKSVLAFQEKARVHCAQNNLQFPTEQQKQCEKVLEQSINDASLNNYDITRVREHVLKIEAGQGLKRSVDLPSARRHNPKLLPAIDAILQICPADESKQEMKVLCLASSKKWTEIMSFCEVLGCQNVELDELYVGDLRSHFPFPGVPAAKYLKSSMKSEINLGTLKLDPNQVSEVALRLPSTIAPFYIRALRLEELYPEANHALLNIENFVKESSNSILSPSKLRSRNEKFSWITQEKEKVRKTMTEKENGDNCFRNGDYTAAASWYANAILIDSANTSTKISNVYDIETSGGRLHAVLHCNRAACLMALKEFEEAAKECTAALRIEKCYMKAIIRRARCYARMKRFEEAITEYDTWLKYMHEHRKNPTVPLRDECRFDRPSKISESDYKKAINERSQVQKDKLAEDDRVRKAAAEAQRRSANEYNRRQQWQHQYKSRSSWNFEGKSPNRNNFSSSNRYGFDQNGKSDQRNRFDNSSEYGRRRRNDGNSDTNPSPSSNNITCHYQVLQVPKTATDIEIKKAYRKLALKYHPDKNQSKEAVDTFRKVKTAYETLSDATQRRNYDFESVRFYY